MDKLLPDTGIASAGTLALLEELTPGITGIITGFALYFRQMEWAEDEVLQAQIRHPNQADLLYHTRNLTAPTSGHYGWGTEFVFRAHCRELLERVAAGEDTRPGTDVEIILGCNVASAIAPMTHAGAGLYFRLWNRAFPDHPVPVKGKGPDDWDEYLASIEKVEKHAISDMERDLRRKLTWKERVLGEITCDGNHLYGESGEKCRFRTERTAAA